MFTSEKSTDVLPAFVALQVALMNPVKDTAGAVKGGKAIPYLSLPALLDHIAPRRREAMLAVAQEITDVQGDVGVTTYLIHVSGQWIAFGPTVFPASPDPQHRGAVISYARRYSLLAALGLAAEDDDAAGASKVSKIVRPAPSTVVRADTPGEEPGEGPNSGVST